MNLTDPDTYMPRAPYESTLHWAKMANDFSGTYAAIRQRFIDSGWTFEEDWGNSFASDAEMFKNGANEWDENGDPLPTNHDNDTYAPLAPFYGIGSIYSSYMAYIKSILIPVAGEPVGDWQLWTNGLALPFFWLDPKNLYQFALCVRVAHRIAQVRCALMLELVFCLANRGRYANAGE